MSFVKNILSKPLLVLAAAVLLPCLAWSLFSLGMDWAAMERVVEGAHISAEMKRRVLFNGLSLIITLAGVLAGAYWWHRRYTRQIDTLVEACHRMSLGEPSPLPDAPQQLEQLGRLALAIQVMHEALLDYLSLYRRFFDAAPDMFLSLAPAGQRILDANTAFCRTVGLLKDEVLGQPVNRFVELDKGWEEALNSGSEFISGQIKTDSGIIKVEASISLEGNPEGQPWVLGAILRDVTLRDALHGELLQKSTALEKALEEIRNVDELKDEFLTTLSHELKTPLVSLKGFLQLLRQGRADQEQSGKYLDICWRNLSKLETQINNLLDLARLSHSKEQYEMAPVDLNALVRTAAENLAPAAAERRVTLDTSGLAGGPLVVNGNLNKLVQLVDNLLVNAIKYNKEDGQVLLGLDNQDGQVVLTVADSGVGIDREHTAAIFNRFYRADLSGTGRLEGLGIGLSLVQEIVKLHNGDIRVESEPGVGTTFTVTLEAGE
ncbi:MAG: PAS domain-containing protein [Desulfarculaceae bacterium]|nr:PAS domain-containing protein [Desulfarculaceae bacterium]MCF8071794.1 PAS domain-containing protein [Desulfarculaceae bacterium]MCF8101344.1 PAS domain-containing protein [Desulfarculaceae bacterium]MCF8117195.1 PAS domain-containing protein [Desulfarculaceae bacterium]